MIIILPKSGMVIAILDPSPGSDGYVHSFLERGEGSQSNNCFYLLTVGDNLKSITKCNRLTKNLH